MLLPQTPTIAHLLDSVFAAERAHSLQNVTIDLDSRQGSSSRQLRVTLTENRAIGKYLLQARGSEEGIPYSRVFYLAGHKMLGFDQPSNDFIVRNLPAGAAGSLLTEELHAGPALVLPIDPASANDSLFKSLKALPNWKLTKRDDSIEAECLVRQRGIETNIYAVFSATSHLPTRLDISSQGSYERAAFSYAPAPKNFAFSVPASALQVLELRTRYGHPKFADAAAAKLAAECLSAYRRLRWIQFKVAADSENASISWHGVQAVQTGQAVSWAYDGTTLSIRDGRLKRFYRGDIRPESITDYLAPLGARIDPTLLELMEGQNPLLAWYSPLLSCRVAGNITLRGVSYGILELSLKGIKTQMRIRNDNHLIGGIVTENFGPSGNEVSRSERSIEYLSVSRKLPLAQFRLQRQGKPEPLSSLLKS